jgi:hypothetical protein
VLEPEPVVDVALEPESERIPEAEAEDGQERKSEAVVEPQPEPGSDESAKLKGSTLKRLLWGADSRED